MSDDRTPYKHDASDKKLDQSAEAAADAATAAAAHTHPTHDPEQIRKHDDTAKDRLFEGRIQHDDADKASDRNRLEKDVARHHHDPEEVGTISDKDQHPKK